MLWIGLQVGGWVKDRQPVIVKKLLGNLNCGLSTVTLNGIDLGFGKLLTFRHRAFSILGQAFHYSPENAFYIFNQQIYFII